MQRATLDGVELDYEISGSGEPVVFIHGAFIADVFRPLLAEPRLTARHRLIAYHRRGYVGSTRTLDPMTVAQQASDCLELLSHLGIQRAHVVGHSYGGAVALQVALDAPDTVHSLALLEPALAAGATAQGYRDALARGVQRYHEAGAAVVLDEFLQARWPGYRAALERVLPGAFAQAVADAETWFEREVRGIIDWRFDAADAQRVTQPTLAVLGGNSEALWPRFGETHRQLLAWLPRATGFVLPAVTHCLQHDDPRGLADALADISARHPFQPQAHR
jgi:pimeloyl-ACP methyl ester carboxylesterase